jgi:peptidoglycan/xylan/chitin deacetylase (PgdA/CDA1 family)
MLGGRQKINSMKKSAVLVGVLLVALIGLATWLLLKQPLTSTHSDSVASSGITPSAQTSDSALSVTSNVTSNATSSAPATALAAGFVDHSSADLRSILADYRKTIVLMVDEKSLSAPDLQAAHQVGEAIFHDMHEQSDTLLQRIGERFTPATPTRVADIEALLDYIESDPSLFDADRLAFKDVLQGMQLVVAKDSTLPAIKLDKRINEDLAALEDIEHQYDQEIRQIFSRFETRAIVQKRERWDDYAAHLKTIYTRETILKDYGVIVPYPLAATAGDRDTEFFGTDFPDKTIALTFDDGPHPQYTLEIEAILKQYGVPAVFFTVGKNLGTVDASGKVTLSANAAISRRLVEDHFVLGNHSFTHAQLAKESGAQLNDEIMKTDAVLRAVDPNRSPLFRFPFGARNKEGLQLLGIEHLQSVLWNIDSLDWADPIPNSVADRVLREVDQQHRGIILFHDIHDRAIKALPIVLDRLIADGYSFAGWDGHTFKVPNTVAAKAIVTAPDYSDSDAIVIGIHQYQKWPKLNMRRAMQTVSVKNWSIILASRPIT